MGAAQIHPTALVAPGAVLGEDVVVGPYSLVGEHVRVGARTRIGPHCAIDGHTVIGPDNHFYRYCSIGGIPQDKKYAGEPTALEIGAGNTFREFVTVNTGTVQDVGTTRLGTMDTTTGCAALGRRSGARSRFSESRNSERGSACSMVST